MLLSRLKLFGLCLPLIVFVSSEPARVEFAPAPQSRLTQVVEWGSEMTTEEFRLDLGGQIVDSAEGLEQSISERLVVEELYLDRSESGVPDTLRTYSEVQRKVEASNPEEDNSLEVGGLGPSTGAIEGHQVLFHWNEEADEFEPTWGQDDPGGAPDEWLDELEANLGLSAFLPTEEVEEGDTWSVEPAAIRFLLKPGGNLDPKEDSEEREESGPGSIHISVPNVGVGDYLGDIQGEIHCQLLALEEMDQGRVAVIRIRVELRAEDEISEQIAEDNPDDEPFDFVERGLVIEGEGDLSWDLDGKHLVSLEFKGEAQLSLSAEWSLDVMQEDFPVQMESMAQGSLHCTFELE